jgi:SAM-dependent methyltransferase
MSEAHEAYAAAGEHYTSTARRDWVKRAWEEPAFHRHLEAALERAAGHGLRPALDVLDVGCGTGVALDLLLAAPSLTSGRRTLARATGLDLDEGLLAIARGRFAGDARVGFVRGDLSAAPDTGPHDLVLSSGVPFSHLAADRLEPALARIAQVALGTAGTAGDTRSPAVALLIVDVLGRYSLEWTSRWDRTRWDYRMSFFATDEDVPATPMTTWDGAELAATIRRAASAAGAEVADLRLVDRSLAVGRHTMTGEYTPGLPRLRDLVDALMEPDADVDPARLRIDVALPAAPDEVLAQHAAFTTAWNAALAEPLAAPATQSALAERLRSVEASFETAGLGLGHSLTAFAVLTVA